MIVISASESARLRDIALSKFGLRIDMLVASCMSTRRERKENCHAVTHDNNHYSKRLGVNPLVKTLRLIPLLAADAT